MAKFNEKDLKAWLEDRSSPIFSYEYQSETIYLVRLPFDDNFDFLYSQYNFRKDKVRINESLKFAGLYNRQNGLIYAADYNLRRIEPSVSFVKERTDKEEMSADENKQVAARVEELIGNDKTRLSIQTLTDFREKEDVAYYAKYGAVEEAKRRILNGQDASNINYSCYYSKYELSDNDYLEYILNPQAVVDRHAQAYINNNQERILAELIKCEFLRKETQSLLNDTENRIYKVRDIINAVKESGAKTVNVTIHKDGQDVTFKYEADMLQRDNSYLSSYHIAAKERSKFYDMFGRNADFHYEDITAITYGRNTIYEDSSFEQTESQALTEQTM